MEGAMSVARRIGGGRGGGGGGVSVACVQHKDSHTKDLVHISYTVIWFYCVLYLISYAAVHTKIKRTNIFQQQNFHTCFIYDMGSVRN